MAFTKEIKGKTVIFAKSANFFKVLGEITKLESKQETEKGMITLILPGGEYAVESFKELLNSGEAEREVLESQLNKVGYALQSKLSLAEFSEYVAGLDNSDLVEFAKK
ncbi:hypothetical protein GQR36_20450 [Enterococcus termitis]